MLGFVLFCNVSSFTHIYFFIGSFKNTTSELRLRASKSKQAVHSSLILHTLDDANMFLIKEGKERRS